MSLGTADGRADVRAMPRVDAELVALCREWLVLNQETERAFTHHAGRAGGPPDDVLAWLRRRAPRGRALLRAIAARPAASVVGLQAKAGVVRAQVALGPDGLPGADDAVAWSLAGDLLAIPARPSR